MASKVIARITGGIGNQLFGYAAARRLALVNDAELVLDDTSGFERDAAYQRRYQLDRFRIPCRKATAAERLDPFPRVRRYLKRALNRRRPFESRSYVQQEGLAFDARVLRLEPRGILYLEGYWQSEGYFKDVEATIRSDLRIEPPTDASNIEAAERIRARTAVAVHVRFFDEPGKGGINNNAPSDYYSRAVARMEALAPRAHYFLFSDRPEDARSLVPLPDDRITCVAHNRGDANAYADLWLMTQATHFVIANSTFSWWGAWLGERERTIVIAPDFVMREGKMGWGFEGLLPERWIKV
jgi:Glycosyl transferase family 11